MTTLDESSGNDREVIDLRLISTNRRANKPLTDDEIGRLRKVLEAFERLSGGNGCPVAFRVIHGRTQP